MTEKILDAVILIRLLDETHFKDLFYSWSEHQNYAISIPFEVNDEIKQKGRKDLNNLIAQKIVKVLPKVSLEEIKEIQKKFRKLSAADCSVFYYGHTKNKDSICLTDDGPLRKALKISDINTSGTKGIYNKLTNDKIFAQDEIEFHFSKFKQDPRIFPN
ncbi:hypothetical protein [Candidatus Lokiarchaeum ossiferum]|uniref:hypothetical protein n=1 Tax=Candidatus Lokiarchaeum ossiferum TaxID=2951803 RepID=UPI00352FDD7B